MANAPPQGAVRGAALRAFIAESSPNADGTASVKVKIPSYDLSKQFGPMLATSRSNRSGTLALPTRGMDCLVSFDENDEPQLVNWFGADATVAPAGGFAPGGTTASRLSALEARAAFTATTVSTTISVSPNVDAKIPYSDVAAGGIDLEGVYDNANSRFVAPSTDWYSFNASIAIPAPGAVGTRWILRLFINNLFARSLWVDWTDATWSNDFSRLGESGRLRLTAGDVVDIRIVQNSAGAINVGNGNSNICYFSGGRA
jgi:hypothetical protein